MKQTPELDRIQARMQPGVMTLKGFLGNDDRKLSDIIAHDALSLAKVKMTNGLVADTLEKLTEKARDIMEIEKIIDGRYKITVRDDRGLIPSPWGDGLFGKGDSELIDMITGLRFRWNGLTIHMIRNHGFYNGRGSDYRIEPELFQKIVDLKS